MDRAAGSGMNRGRRLGPAVALALAVVLGWHARSAFADALVELQAGQRLHQELAVQQTRGYHISLVAGEAATLVVQQDQGAIELRQGGQGDGSGSPRRANGGRLATIRWTLTAETDQSWDFEISAADSPSATAYWISLGQAHPASEADRKRAAAEQAFATAEDLRRGGDKAQVSMATAAYEQAIRAWGLAQDSCALRSAYVGQALLQQDLDNYPGTLKSARAALQQACADDPAEQAYAERLVANGSYNQGDYVVAAAVGERAVALLKQTGDPGLQGRAWRNLAVMYRALGESLKALDAASTAQKFAQASGDHETVLAIQSDIGTFLGVRGELAPALEAYRKTLDELPVNPPADSRGAYASLAGVAWGNLGYIQWLLGDSAEAYKSYAQSESICTAEKDWVCLADTTASHAESLLDDGRPNEAAAASRRVLDLGNANDMARSRQQGLLGLGRSALAMGDLTLAQAQLQVARKGLAHDQEPDEQSRVYAALGDLEGARHSPVAARRDYQRALALARHSGNSVLQTPVLGSLARISRETGDFDAARREIEQAIGIIESERTLINDPGLRTSYFTSMRSYYALDIDLLMQLDRLHPNRGYAAAALEASERARARSLQDLLAERTLTVDGEVDADLLSQERAVADHVHALAYQIAQLSTGATAKRVQLQAELDQADAGLDRVRGRIRKANPRYAELVRPERITTHEIQRALLDDDSVLLEYWLGEQHSYLWAVNRKSVRAYILPASAPIEAAASELRNQLAAEVSPGSQVPIENLRQVRAENLEAVRKLSASLGLQLLGPVDAALHDKNVVVVADGALQQLPFNILESAAFRRSSETLHNWVYLPSIETVRWLRGGPEHAAISTAVAVMADPVFRADDSRLGGHADVAPAPNQQVVMRAASDAGVENLERLSYSREEAQKIAALATAGPSWVALDFAASRQAALQATWQNYALVHFATHTLLDLQHPELSGIVLSLYDPEGHPQDGFLRMNDIYNLRIPADLVVLSTCESALGKTQGEEGLFSLSRAFFHAGARRVLASLWRVDDRASAVFMDRFYQAVLKGGLKPAQALRQAQQEMADDPQWSLPYYWAGYVLQGDWR
jgi:CHAT domain-containing protein